MELYTALDGEKWRFRNESHVWGPDGPECYCDWEGVDCNNRLVHRVRAIWTLLRAFTGRNSTDTRLNLSAVPRVSSLSDAMPYLEEQLYGMRGSQGARSVSQYVFDNARHYSKNFTRAQCGTVTSLYVAAGCVTRCGRWFDACVNWSSVDSDMSGGFWPDT